MTKERWFLLVAALGLIPIALAYGVVPSETAPLLYGIEVAEPSLKHVFRAVMGLYLATAAFWLAGVLVERLQTAALYSLVVFMFGIAAGRALSLLLDGVPSPLLLVYLLLEISFGSLGVALLRRSRSYLETRYQ